MANYFIRNFGVGVLFNIIEAIPLSIICGLIGLPIIYYTDTGLIGAAVIMGILGTIAYFFLYALYKHITDERGVVGTDVPEVFATRLKEKKPISAFKVYLMCLPNLLIAVLFIIIIISNYDTLYAMRIQMGEEATDISGFGEIITGICSITVVVHFFHSITFLVYHIRATCPKCHRIFSHVDVGTSDYNKFDNTDYMSKSSEVKVGSIYADKEKIGNIYQKQTTNYERSVKGATWRTKYRCEYCGHEYTASEGYASLGEWNER